jgi:RNA polymerase sigma-70 factor (ECF subfamily)
VATTRAATAAETTAEAATTSAPESFRGDGRPLAGAAAARTEELYARHGRLVSGLCRGLLRDRAEAEDAAQQTFLAAHRALMNGTSPREPAAWLATIARNECWSRIRSRMREPLPTDELEAESGGVDPLGEAIRNADLAALWRAIAELPRPQRDALLLREFGGLTYVELAEALAVTGPAVESLLFRARQGLRSRLETVYAAVSGASLVEALARLLAGASGTAAPVLAKAVVAAGVGAAVATGGVVVAPHVFDLQRAPRAHHAVHGTAGAAAPPPAQPSVAATPPLPSHPVLVLASLPAKHDGRDGGSSSGDEGTGGGGSGDGHGAVSGGERSSATRPAEGDSHDGARGIQGSDEGGSSSGDSVQRSGSDGGDGGRPSGDGGRPSGDAAPQPSGDGAGVTVTVPNPAVTVTVPSGDPSSDGGD